METFSAYRPALARDVAVSFCTPAQRVGNEVSVHAGVIPVLRRWLRGASQFQPPSLNCS